MSGTGSSKDPSRHRALAIAIAAVALLTVSLVPTAGGTSQDPLVVGPTGTDDGDCTAEDPCRTIQHAVDQAEPGDTVLVRPGVYDEAVTVDVAELTLCATYPRGAVCPAFVCVPEQPCPQPKIPNAVVDATDSSSNAVLTVEAADVTVRGFTFISGTAQSGVRLAGATHAAIEDNRIVSNAANENLGVRTIGIDAVADGVTIEDNVLSGWIANAIGVWRSDARISGNTILDSRVGVHLSGVADDTDVHGNTFEGTLYAVRFAGTADRQANHVEVQGNRLDGSNVAPIRLEANTHDLTVDARYNWWGAALCEVIDARIDDQGSSNTVLIAPYTGPTGTQLPADGTC